MISKKLQDAINEQINREFFSEYLYNQMKAWCVNKNLNGFANFFNVQMQEENLHYTKFYNYLLERGGMVELKAVAKPENDFTSITQMFEKTLAHEQYITRSINELMDLAVAEKDYATQSFLKFYVDEQVEEEATMETAIGKLAIFDGDGPGLYMLDQEMATRTFTPPANAN